MDLGSLTAVVTGLRLIPATSRGGEKAMMPGNGYMGGWGWIFMSLSTLVFLALIALVVWLAVRTTSGSPSQQHSSTHAAKQVLAERYARGEIDEQEYQQRLRILDG
jgi:putative membrane protein